MPALYSALIVSACHIPPQLARSSGLNVVRRLDIVTAYLWGVLTPHSMAAYNYGP